MGVFAPPSEFFLEAADAAPSAEDEAVRPESKLDA